MKADYHVHCNFSDDSDETMEAQVRRAIELGLDEICMTDHVDYGIKSDWDDEVQLYRRNDGSITTDETHGLPSRNVNYPLYFHTLQELKSRFGERIQIREGLEFGIQTGTTTRFQKLYDRYSEQLDFILLSMHQVDNLEFRTQDFQRGRTQKEYNERYYREIYDVQKVFHSYSVLAHLNLLSRYDEQGIYPFEKVQDYIAEILRQAIRDNKGIEVNTSGYRYGLGDTQPSCRILKLYRDLGGRIITIGSDAHRKEDIADRFDTAKEMLKGLGYTQFCTFDHMKPIFHSL